jgi:hypothetical protein
MVRPEFGESRPRISRIVVDLPDPFGPRNPVTTPGSTVNVRSLTAILSPYRFVTFVTSIIRLAPFEVCRSES